MSDFRIIYIISQRGEPNFEKGVEDLPHEGDEDWYNLSWWSNAYTIAMTVTCWGYLCYCKEGEEDLFKSDVAEYIQGRYYLPAQLLQHASEYVEVWLELLKEGKSELMFLDEDHHLHFKLSDDGTVSISYRTSSMFIRSYSGISLENLRDEFYRFGKNLLEGYVFKVKPDLRRHPDFAKLAKDLEAMIEMDL